MQGVDLLAIPHSNTQRLRDTGRLLTVFAMKYSFGLAALAALATASDVHDLTKDTFEPFVKENDLVLAECTSHANATPN